MTITIIGVNYSPEDTAIGLYTSQLAEYLVRQNVDVEVITGFPYYPAWNINKEYKNKSKFYQETIRGVKIYRYKQYVPKEPTFFKRVLLLLDFTFGSFINLFKIKQTDLVLAIVPFTSSILLGKILAKRKKAKLWVHIQDFEFDAAAEANLVNTKDKKSILFKLLFWVEKTLLNKADTVSTISNAMLKKLESKTASSLSKKLLPNWVDIDFINPKYSTIHGYLKSKKFKILYAGNIGEKQNWNLFIELVKSLIKNNDIEFVVVGDGAKKQWLVEQTKSFNIVTHYNPVTYEELPDLLCSADLHILFQKDNVVDTVMPSKILGMMASEKPSLITGNLASEVASIINKSQGGLYLASNDIESISSRVIELKENVELANEFGKNARNYVENHYSSDVVLKNFKNTSDDLIQ